MILGGILGFSIAWQVKPAVMVATAEVAPPQRTRAGRQEGAYGARPAAGKSAASAYSQRWQRPVVDSAALFAFSRRWDDTGQEDSGGRKEALCATLGPNEFPPLIAGICANAGLSGLDGHRYDQLRALFKAWHAKAPETALAWWRTLPEDEFSQELFGKVAENLSESNLDGALAMLRQDSSTSIPRAVAQKAAMQGADKLLEVCTLKATRQDISQGSCQLVFPKDFDFKRVLNGLAAAQSGLGEGETFRSVPINLLRDWAKRDAQGASAWLKEGKKVVYNGIGEFIWGATEGVPPAAAGTTLAAVFDPTKPADRCYDDVRGAFRNHPSPEMLDAFLQAAPGDRAEHLAGLFDGSSDNEMQALLLERMSPAQRIEVVRVRYKDTQGAFSAQVRTLRALGHSEEDIREMLPGRRM